MFRSIQRQRGTAMTETIFALPFLLIILLFITYFGRQSVNVERTHMMARYQAWRSANGGSGPMPNVGVGDQQMNDTWFNNNADNMVFWGHNQFPTDAFDLWRDAAGRRSDDAGLLLDSMWDNYRTYAQGSTANVQSRHNTSNKITEVFNNNVHSSHTVIEGDWKFFNGYGHRATAYDPGGNGGGDGTMVHNLYPLRDTFYDAFDSTLEGMSDAQNPLASTIRSFYLNTGGYGGPTVP